MRIIAGKHRGRTLACFEGEDVRPTADRVKESVFQICSARFAGADVLDLFCGSGALGIESLSRGAAEVTFNDVSAQSLSLVQRNLRRVRETGDLSHADFRVFLAHTEKRFDLIFSDPPYRENFLPEICKVVRGRALLKQNGLLVHEGEREEPAPEGWERSDMRRYGRTVVCFFRIQTDSANQEFL